MKRWPKRSDKITIVLPLVISGIGLAFVVPTLVLLVGYAMRLIGVPCVSTAPRIVGIPAETQPITQVNLQNISLLYQLQGNGDFDVLNSGDEHTLFSVISQSYSDGGRFETCGYLSRLIVSQQTVRIDQLTAFEPVRKYSNGTFPMFVTLDAPRNVFINANGQVWNADHSEIVNQLALPQEAYPLSRLWFDAGGDRYLVQGSSEYYIFNGNNYSDWRALDMPGDVNRIAVSDGMIAYATDHSVELIGRNGQTETLLRTDDDARPFLLWALNFSPDGAFLVVSVDYEETTVWDTDSGDAIMTAPDIVGRVHFDSKSDRTLICSMTQCAIISIAAKSIVDSFSVDGLRVISVHPSGHFFVIGNVNGDIEFRTFSGALMHRSSIGDFTVEDLAFSSDLRQFLITYSHPYVRDTRYDRTGMIDRQGGIMIYGVPGTE